jgi:hypothetical protein
MDFHFGYFEDMDSYFAREELNAYHDMLDSIPMPTYDEVNELLSRLADENMIVMVNEEILA